MSRTSCAPLAATEFSVFSDRPGLGVPRAPGRREADGLSASLHPGEPRLVRGADGPSKRRDTGPRESRPLRDRSC